MSNVDKKNVDKKCYNHADAINIQCRNCEKLITFENTCFLCKRCHDTLYKLKKQYITYEGVENEDKNNNVHMEEPCRRCEGNVQFLCAICVKCHKKCCTLLSQAKCDYCETDIATNVINCATCQKSYHNNCYKWTKKCCNGGGDNVVELCTVCKNFVKTGDVTASCKDPYHERCYSLRKIICNKCEPEEKKTYLQTVDGENFHVALINTESLLKLYKKNFFQDFAKLLQELQFDIVCITESWLKPDHSNEKIKITGYKFERIDRVGERGGGLLIYYKDHLNCDKIDLPINADKVEQLWCTLKIGAVLVAIGLIYKRPGVNFENFLQVQESLKKVQESLEKIQKCNVVILLGDFNIDFMPKRETGEQKFLKNVTASLYQVVYDITRESTKTQGEGIIIDHIYCDRIEICEKVCILDTGYSDHRLIDCSFNLANLTLRES